MKRAHRLIVFFFFAAIAGACGGEGAINQDSGQAGPGPEGTKGSVELDEFNQSEGLKQGQDGSFTDAQGRTCATPTPCGNCGFDCTASGNPFRQPGEPFDIQQDVCLDLELVFTEAIPTVVLLIDQSGSMDQNFGGINRLDATYGALMDPVDGLVASLQDRYRFGMALYTSYDGGPTCPNIRDVKPEFNNFETINRVFEPAKPEDDTPTGEAIQGIMRMFEEDDVRGPKVVLLATDGEPDTCGQPDPQNGQPEAVAAAQEAFTKGVETIVLSVGEEVSERHLQDMADAGAGKPVGRGANVPFFKANDPDALKTSLRDIIVGTRECIIQVGGGILDPALATQGSVKLNGTELTLGDNGWKFHQNEQTCFGSKQCLELTGRACEIIQNERDVTLEGNFPCVYGDPDGENGYGTTYAPGPGGNGAGIIPTYPGNGGPGGGGPGGGGGTGGPGGGGNQCVAAGGRCTYDGDCCSGICGESGGMTACVLN